jgi:hypothetical protein
MMLSEERLPVIFGWLYGDFTSASWSKLTSVLPYVAATSVVLLALSRQLNLLQLSEETKQNRWACASSWSRRSWSCWPRWRRPCASRLPG